MPNALRFNWASIAIASVSVWLLSVVAVAGAIFIHAFSLGWAARGAPDSEAIRQFADAIGPVWGFRLGVILTAIATIWIWPARADPADRAWRDRRVCGHCATRRAASAV